MTEQERGHIRHIASIARAARRDLRMSYGMSDDIARTIKTLEEIENSARHALAANLASVDS